MAISFGSSAEEAEDRVKLTKPPHESDVERIVWGREGENIHVLVCKAGNCLHMNEYERRRIYSMSNRCRRVATDLERRSVVQVGDRSKAGKEVRKPGGDE